MIGTIIGDVVGSAYEFSHFKGKDFDPFFHPKARFTDDTVCTVAVADALTRGADPQTTLIEWCRRYAENGGWGKQFALWFLDDNPQPYGSWGNGAAMRISPIGLLARTEAEAVGWSDNVTAITHNHPDAMHTAQAVALAIFWARRKISAHDIAQQLTERYGYPLHLAPDDIRPGYKRTEKAIDSVPQAISCALHSTNFEDAIRNAVSLGGDSDTIAAIAGSIAEALHGIPGSIAVKAWTYLPKDMKAVISALYTELESSTLTEY
ncbi:MAG: ADP-ribosylglycohydrolase family protein [Rhodoferax sp.]